MKEKNNKFSKMETVLGFLIVVTGSIGLILFLLSYNTGYFIFGQMNSIMILAFILTGILAEVFTLYAIGKWGEYFWVRLLTFVVTALFSAAAILLIGDRVEAIGNCVITDFDSGHGGEEAVYRSLAASGIMLLGVVLNIAGSFSGYRQKQQVNLEQQENEE